MAPLKHSNPIANIEDWKICDGKWINQIGSFADVMQRKIKLIIIKSMNKLGRKKKIKIKKSACSPKIDKLMSQHSMQTYNISFLSSHKNILFFIKSKLRLFNLCIARNPFILFFWKRDAFFFFVNFLSHTKQQQQKTYLLTEQIWILIIRINSTEWNIVDCDNFLFCLFVLLFFFSSYFKKKKK